MNLPVNTYVKILWHSYKNYSWHHAFTRPSSKPTISNEVRLPHTPKHFPFYLIFKSLTIVSPMRAGLFRSESGAAPIKVFVGILGNQSQVFNILSLMMLNLMVNFQLVVLYMDIKIYFLMMKEVMVILAHVIIMLTVLSEMIGLMKFDLLQ